MKADRVQRRLGLRPEPAATFSAPRRIGLVLAGGGAKGAYQVGCLRALRQAGIDRFSAISGSSVGAIHAVLLATGKLDRAAAAWRRLRVRDVVQFVPRRFALIPTWMIAAFTSEFSPFSVWRFSDTCVHPVWSRRWAYFGACAVSALAFAAGAAAVPQIRVALLPIAGLLLACAVLIAFNGPLRRHFLEQTFLSNAPLRRTLATTIRGDDCRRMRAAGVPVYATVSRFRPYTREAVPWGGWIPQYVRLDRLRLSQLLDVLVCGSALPGFSGRTTGQAEVGIDGAWTDVVPIAPLLSHRELDLDIVFVIYLKPRFRHRPRHNSLLGVASVLLDDLLGRRRDGPADLIRWAETRLQAAGGCDGTTGREAPRIVPVMPSQRVGNFFSGTLWFQASRSERLVALGEKDMREVLAALSAEEPGWASIAPTREADTPRGTTPGEYAPSPA